MVQIRGPQHFLLSVMVLGRRTSNYAETSAHVRVCVELLELLEYLYILENTNYRPIIDEIRPKLEDRNCSEKSWITCERKGPSKSKMVCPLTSTCLTNVPKMRQNGQDKSENGCPKLEGVPK